MLLIIHGKKNARAFQRWTSMFCPICRSVYPHPVQRVSLVPHVYGVATGNGTQLHDELTCDNCSSVAAAPFGTMRMSAVRESRPLVGRVDKEVYPWSIAELDARLELEQRAHAGSVTPDERRFLLCEPFARVEYEYRLAMQRGVWVSVMSVLLLLTLGSVIAAYILWSQQSKYMRPSALHVGWTYGMIGASVVTILCCAWLFVAMPRLNGRRARRLILSSLAPLRPSPDEMAEAIGLLPRDRMSPARAVRPSDFAAAHAAARVSGPSGR